MGRTLTVFFSCASVKEKSHPFKVFLTINLLLLRAEGTETAEALPLPGLSQGVGHGLSRAREVSADQPGMGATLQGSCEMSPPRLSHPRAVQLGVCLLKASMRGKAATKHGWAQGSSQETLCRPSWQQGKGLAGLGKAVPPHPCSEPREDRPHCACPGCIGD